MPEPEGMIAAPAWAQSPASAASEHPPRQVGELLELIEDPAVRDWLEAQWNADDAPPAAVPSEKARIENYFGGHIAAKLPLRAHRAPPNMPLYPRFGVGR
jgi:hypothetical protein